MAESSFNISEDGTSPGASVLVAVFSDFQCPACEMAAPEMKQAMEYYGSRVNFIFKHYPIKEGSSLAAQASECARDQGKFWEFHDALFASSQKPTAESLAVLASGLGLDSGEFHDCIYSGIKLAKVESDFREGASAGIRGTPTFIINGAKYEGALSFSELKQIIGSELK